MRGFGGRVVFVLLLVVGVAAQDDDLPRVEAFDEVEMVYVPAGCFSMGADDGYPDEAPMHEVCIESPFWVDRYEVSNSQFTAFGGTSELAPATTDPDLPRTQIMWIEAARFCEARGGRLPTEAEWEYAARGAESLVYPWGNDFDAAYANTCDSACGWGWRDVTGDDGYAAAAPVDALPEGASWVGARQMSGNVWEWTSSIYNQDRFPYPYTADDGREGGAAGNVPRVVRGGAWDDMPQGVRASVRAGYFAFYDTHDWLGFRCVRDLDS